MPHHLSDCPAAHQAYQRFSMNNNISIPDILGFPRNLLAKIIQYHVGLYHLHVLVETWE
jgi:hypothetical protein